MKDDKAEISHRSLAVEAYNECWKYIQMENRTASDNAAMRRLAEVSYYHWNKAPECQQNNISVGLWQLGRVYALSGLPQQALEYAETCILVAVKGELLPFYIAYGWEAKARALKYLKDEAQMQIALKNCRKFTAKVEKEEERSWLENDIKSIED